MPYSESQPRIGQLIAGIHEGAQRIKKIVQNLRDFARKDTGEMTQEVDVNPWWIRPSRSCATSLDKCTARFALDLDPRFPGSRATSSSSSRS